MINITKEELEENYVRHQAFGLNNAWLEDYKYSKRYLDDKYYFCLEDISQELGEKFLEEKFFEIPDCFELVSTTTLRLTLNQSFKFKVKADGLMILPMGMFLYNMGLTDISLKNCETISLSAFKGTRNLNSVYCPNIEYINKKAFKESGIKSIDVTNAYIIDDEAFYHCNLCDFQGKDYNNLCYLGRRSFYDSSIEYMNIPGLDKISAGCFEKSKIKYFCTNLSLPDYYTFDDIFKGSTVNKVKFGNK